VTESRIVGQRSLPERKASFRIGNQSMVWLARG
jgi:hypothetical protein